jgi:RNA 2',3'-cyclic 3'-phosphodiesterase
VTPPQAVRQRLHEHAAALGHPQLRVLPAENLHVTVLFLGPVVRDAIEELAGRLGAVAAGEAVFALSIGQAVPGPPRRPYMLWAQVAVSAPLVRLSRAMHEVAQPLAPELSKPLRGEAHITLARGRGRVRGITPSEIEPAPPAFEVWALQLLRSHLSPTGARYETVAELPLATTTA